MISFNTVSALLIAFMNVLLNAHAFAQDFPLTPESGFGLSEWDSLLVGADAHAQRSTLTWHSMITNLPGDWSRHAQMTFQASSLPAIGGIAALTGGFMLVDDGTLRASHSLYHESSFIRSTSNIFVRMGDGKTHIGVAAAFGLYGWIADDSRALRTASQTMEALIASGLVVQVLKRITGRESPQAATRETGRWQFFPNMIQYQKHQPKYYAFPSGHITSMMATVTVITENYPEVGWLRPVGYAVVGLVGVSLVNIGYHWYSDLPLGIALGYTFGKAIAHPEGIEHQSTDDPHATKISIAPRLGPLGAGVTAAVTF